jgi:serine/threonine protein kinase
MYPISDSYCTKNRVSKPSLPYQPGRHLTLLSHQPPAPTTFDCSLNSKTADERRSKHPLARCLSHSPLPGKDGHHTAELVICRPIRVGDEHSAQVMAVRVKSSSSNDLPTDTDLAAKIYDPLYFDHEQDEADPFLCVDRDYSHETAAYTALSTLQGGIIPKYFGSFSIKLRAGPTFRTVRLILFEFIPGQSMRQLSSAKLSQPIRQTIMKAVIDAESLIYTHNVVHMDMRPANVLICGIPQVQRVVIIDFGQCAIGRHPLRQYHQKYLPGVPISPLLRWNKPRGNFESWIDWDWLAWLNHVYEPTRASITDDMRSLFLPPPEPLYEPPPLEDMSWLWK